MNTAKELLDKVFPKGRIQRKTNIVSFYMSADELDRLINRAEQASVSIGAFARTATQNLLDELDSRDRGKLSEERATSLIGELSRVVEKALTTDELKEQALQHVAETMRKEEEERNANAGRDEGETAPAA